MTSVSSGLAIKKQYNIKNFVNNDNRWMITSFLQKKIVFKLIYLIPLRQKFLDLNIIGRIYYHANVHLNKINYE